MLIRAYVSCHCVNSTKDDKFGFLLISDTQCANHGENLNSDENMRYIATESVSVRIDDQ